MAANLIGTGLMVESVQHKYQSARPHEVAVMEMQTAGLLSFVEGSRVPQALQSLFKELGYGGIGWAPYGVVEDKGTPLVIYPVVVPLVEGLPTVTLAQVTMREGAPADAWGVIEWFVGAEPPSTEEIERLRSATIEVEEKVDIQEVLQPYGQLPTTPLPCVIVCKETESGKNQYGNPAKYVFSAQVATQVRIKTYRKYTFGAYGYSFEEYRNAPVLAERIEERPCGHTFENIAYGNEFFEGESQLEIVLAGHQRNPQWTVRWNATETIKDPAKSSQ